MKHTFDCEERALVSVTNITYLMETMNFKDTVDILNVGFNELDQIKQALTCLCCATELVSIKEKLDVISHNSCKE